MTRRVIIHPDGMEGGWGGVEVKASPGVMDEILLLDEIDDGWADELVAAIELEARRQVLRDRCPPALRDIVACLRAGTTSGRSPKTEHNAIREIRAAIRGAGPRQREMFSTAGTDDPQPRTPTPAGRPRLGKPARVLETETDGQGVLL